MSTINGVVGSVTMTEKTVMTDDHPIVTRTFSLKANNGTLEAGTILALNGSNTAEAWQPAGTAPLNVPVGVLMYKADTAKDTIGISAVHGVCQKKALLVSGGTAPSAANITTLETTLMIWVV